ncbi:MAG: beta strand repeat-containing protein, partial [Bacteroidia bacterium]
SYLANTDFALAEQINVHNRVVFRASGTSSLITNLNSQTAYTVTAYEYQNTGNCYNLIQASTRNIFTLSPEPASQISSLSVLATSATSIDLNFPAFSGISNTDGYLILMKSGSASTGLPVDSNAYSVSSLIGDASLIGIISNPNAVSTTITGLSHSTVYYFKLIPFNWDSLNTSTYNYLTSGTILQDFDTTFVNSAPVLGPVNTQSVLNTRATVSANVVSDGGNAITSRGIIWSLNSLNANPTLNGLACTSVTSAGTTGSFNLELTGLPSNSSIAYVAYATNALGTSYSGVQILQTLQVASQITFGVNPPTSGIAGSALSAFTVEIRRPDLTIDQEYNGTVSVSKFSGSGSIFGTLTVNAVNGIATFSNVKFNLPDSYILQAQASPFSSIQSSSINITATSINLAYQNFESTPANPNWTYTGTGSLSSVSNRFVGTQSYQITGANSIVFDNINISEYNNVSLSVAFAATGVDTDEDLFIDISYDNGLNWAGSGSIQLIDGSSNLNLNINTINGLRTPTGANPYVFAVPAGESQIRIRFRSGTDVPDAGELFFIDEVKVSGIYNPNPIISRSVQTLSGFVSNGLNQSSTIQSFQVSGNNLIDSLIISSSAGFEISLQDGINFSPVNRIALNPVSGMLAQTNIYVRMNPNTLAQSSGSISINSTNLTTQSIQVSGEILNLNAGDIAFVGFDGVGPDRFSFVALKDIPENTRIWFTDKSWDGSLTTPAFTTAEATGVWTSPSGGLAKGTVITMTTDPTFSVTLGTGGLISGLSSVGEQLFAYQGSLTSPRFIAGFTSGSIQSTTTPTISETWIPASLSLGLNFIKVSGTSNAAAFLTNASQINTITNQRTIIHDSLNWTSSSSAVNFPNWNFKILVDEPTSGASFQTSGPITNNSIIINFSGGNGSQCLIVMSSNSTITGLPADGTAYTANSIFGNGSQLNTGEYVIYAGPVLTGSVLVSNLFSGTTYSFKIFSFNGSGNEINYLTSVSSTTTETTTGSALSQLSDVTNSIGFTEPSLIDFINYQESSNLTTSNSVEMAKFTIRDGGASGDLDTFSTIVNSINFVVRNSNAINKLALYNGSIELDEITLTDTLAAFSNFNLNVADNSTADITLRASFNANQTDLIQIQFTLNEINASIAGSRFISSNAGGPSSSISGDRNKINVIASKLIFSQQPLTSLTGLNLNPAPIIAAVDNFLNRDLDFNSVISLSSSKPISTSSVLSVSATQGLASFANISYSVPDTGITLTASSGLLTDVVSNKFDVTYNPQAGDVYISEISYESTQEWIELYNNTDYTINIGNWYITDHSAYPATSEGDCIIPTGTILPAKSFVVISLSGTGTQASDLTDITGEVLTLAGPRGAANRPTLNNSGDNIALYTSSSGGTLMDGSLSVNFPDLSNSSILSIQRIANKSWDLDAFGR